MRAKSWIGIALSVLAIVLGLSVVMRDGITLEKVILSLISALAGIAVVWVMRDQRDHG